MRIAHFNVDEVNQYLVDRTAAEFRASVCPLVPDGEPPVGSFDVVLCNFDEVPRDKRSTFLNKLKDGASRSLTLVHGYGITDDLGQILIQCGMVPVQRLTIELLRLLFAEVLNNSLDVSREPTRNDLIYIDLDP